MSRKKIAEHPELEGTYKDHQVQMHPGSACLSCKVRAPNVSLSCCCIGNFRKRSPVCTSWEMQENCSKMDSGLHHMDDTVLKSPQSRTTSTQGQW